MKLEQNSNHTTSKETELSELPERKTKRWLVFDYVRAIGIMLVIFIHATVYHYGLLATIDIENLNPFFMVLYVILNWAGLFAIISAVVNTYSSFMRLEENFKNKVKNPAWKAFGRRWVFLGVFFLFLNFLYTFLVSPLNMNFDTHEISYSFLAGLIRTGQFYQVSAVKMLYGSVFTMLGWNLIIMGLVFTLIFRNVENYKKKNRRILVLILGIVIILVSFLRIYFYDAFANSVQDGNYFVAYLIDMFAGNYFPILPYLGFGFIGAYFGMILADNPTKKKIGRLIWIGVGWFIAAIIAFLIPDSIYETLGLLDDIFFDYIIVMFEIGFFVVVGSILMILMFDKRVSKSDLLKKDKMKFSTIFLRFSRNSLTFFFLERPISELIAWLLNVLVPGWNNYVWTSILFGLFMVLFWFLIAFLWNIVDFKGSFEWILSKFFKLARFQTDKKY
ncbi:MAG: acyltransferase family protein [Candidatus Heimdallarchaeaceae archaeon]